MSDGTWLKKVSRDLAHVCNGEVSLKSRDVVECKMDNGVIVASVAGDGTRMLIVRKNIGEKVQKASMESLSDEMCVTRSLSGSIEFLHRMGSNPEMRIEQNGKELGDIKVNAYNDKVKTALYGYF